MGPRHFSRGKSAGGLFAVVRDVASMGPRHFSRGKEPEPTPARAGSRELQWGHGISAVESLPTTRKIVLNVFGLQWGHGISAVESHCGQNDQRTQYHASMGPRHFSRGKPPPHATTRRRTRSFNGATAFQPWKAAEVVHRAVYAPVRLQWGHGISAVESITNKLTHVLPFRLQWGHGISAVESCERA